MEPAATRNQITLRGSLLSLPQLSHENHNKQFFRFLLEVPRLSGVVDILPVIAEGSVLDTLDLSGGGMLTVSGQVRSHNLRENGRRHLSIFVFAAHIRAEDGEIQTAILIPKASYDRCFGHYIKYAMRNAMDIATLGCSVNVRLSADKKTVDRARIAYGVAGPVPLRCACAEAAAQGKPLTEATVETFAHAILDDINPRDSWRASKAFRQHIAVEIAKRCFVKSIELAGGELV